MCIIVKEDYKQKLFYTEKIMFHFDWVEFIDENGIKKAINKQNIHSIVSK